MSLNIRGRKLGSGFPCYITFEAGPTHNGPESARRLAKAAADAGADAIKFQIFDPELLIADRSLEVSYEVIIDKATGATETVTERLFDLFERRAMSNEDWRSLREYCQQLDLGFIVTVGDEEGLKLAERLDCDSLKIASSDINHFPFLRQAARTGVCIQLDTGNATFAEIETAVDLLNREGNEDIVIHNCPTGYPARLDSINLRMIPALKHLFRCPVAFSDHTPGWEMDIAALALGADLVEKTITEDRMTRSVEHIMSLEPLEMGQFVSTIRAVETAMGTTRRLLTEKEYDARTKFRRSAYLTSRVAAGQRLADAEVRFLRPGIGIGPDEYEDYAQQDFRFGADMEAGALVKARHLIPPADE